MKRNVDMRSGVSAEENCLAFVAMGFSLGPREDGERWIRGEHLDFGRKRKS